MSNTSNLRSALSETQRNVIGAFKLHCLNYWEPVVEIDNESQTVRTIHVGHLLGLQDSHYPMVVGKLVVFDKSLADLSPIELAKLLPG